MAIFLPRRPAVRPLIPRVDGAHWTSNGLVFAAPAGPEGIHRDVVRGARPVAPTAPIPIAQESFGGFGVGSVHTNTDTLAQNFGDLDYLEGTTGFTAFAFVIPKATTTFQYMLWKADSDSNPGFLLRANDTSGNIGAVIGYGASKTVLVAGLTGNTNTLRIAACTVYGGNAYLYVLDKSGEIASASGSSSLPAASTYDMFVGGRSAAATNGWGGSLHDVRIYDRSWSPEEIVQFLRTPGDWWACYQQRRRFFPVSPQAAAASAGARTMSQLHRVPLRHALTR